MAWLKDFAKELGMAAIEGTIVDTAVRSTKGFQRSSARNDIVSALRDEYASELNLLPSEALERAERMYEAGMCRARERGMETYEKRGDTILTGSPDYCRALRDIEGVHVAEIRDWWNWAGVYREIYLLQCEEMFHEITTAVHESPYVDDRLDTTIAWKFVPVFGHIAPVHGQDPNYTPLPWELIPRVQGSIQLAPWSRGFDRSGGLRAAGPAAEIAELPPTPTMNAWVREQIACGALPPITGPSLG